MPRIKLISYYFLIPILTVILSLQITFREAHASESALSAAPAILEAIAKPGETITKEVTITNTTNFPLPVKGQVSSFLSTEKIPSSLNKTYDASAWFELDPADFILQPHESKLVKIMITSEKDSEPGGHYATVFFQPLIPEEAISRESSISLARIGILSFLIVPGNIHESLTIDSFSAPSFLRNGPVLFNFSLTNNGNIHLIPQISLNITDMFGKSFTISKQPFTILPGTTRTAELEWDKSMLFGKFVATSVVNYGANSLPVTSETISFWVVPWVPIIVAVVLLTLFYKVFILNASRIKLAWAVLRGRPIETETNKNATNIKQENQKFKKINLRSNRTRSRDLTH